MVLGRFIAWLQGDRPVAERADDDAEERTRVPMVDDDEGVFPIAFITHAGWQPISDTTEPPMPTHWDADAHERDKMLYYRRLWYLLSQKKLPPEISYRIFWLAEEGLDVSVSRDDTVTFSHDANMRYLRTPQIRTRLVRNFLIKVVVDIESHDQGYSSDPNADWRGTYNGSHTWFDLSVDRRIDASSGEGKRGAGDDGERARDGERGDGDHGEQHERHEHPHRRERRDSPPRAEAWREVERVELQRNIHASHHFKHHTIVLPADNSLVRAVEPGDSLSLWARTQYPAWTNTVKYARISLWLDWDAIALAHEPSSA